MATNDEIEVALKYQNKALVERDAALARAEKAERGIKPSNLVIYGRLAAKIQEAKTQRDEAIAAKELAGAQRDNLGTLLRDVFYYRLATGQTVEDLLPVELCRYVIASLEECPDKMTSLLGEFDELTVQRDELARVLEHANVELAALVQYPSQAAGKASMWPLENAADRECIRSAFEAIRAALKKQGEKP